MDNLANALNIARGGTGGMTIIKEECDKPLHSIHPENNPLEPFNLCEASMKIECEIAFNPHEGSTTAYQVAPGNILRKVKDAERKRMVRENESQEDREKRKSRAAYLARIRRTNLSLEAKLRTRVADRERAKMKRACETLEERETRLKRDAERKRFRRQNHSQFKQLLEHLEQAAKDPVS